MFLALIPKRIHRFPKGYTGFQKGTQASKRVHRFPKRDTQVSKKASEINPRFAWVQYLKPHSNKAVVSFVQLKESV